MVEWNISKIKMGYRNYLMSFPKKEYLKIRNKTERELTQNSSDDYFDWHELDKKGLKEIYEFGKYCDFKTKGITKSFFSKKMSFEDDNELLIADKRLILHCIDNYRKKVADWYKKLSDKPIEEIKTELDDKAKKWAGGWIPYNIDEKKEHLVEAWEYEYVIFDLVRILKTFDFKKNVLVYAGY